ncbi:MAG TPA: archaeosortase/exosortase family protein [Burkholderiaceae bacterium]|nr:archaeosortase/exosortase family protein [Burkholderiaceae bacterium]
MRPPGPGSCVVANGLVLAELGAVGAAAAGDAECPSGQLRPRWVAGGNRGTDRGSGALLHARIGRRRPTALLAATRAEEASQTQPRGRSTRHAWTLLAVLLGALWPHWLWMARRMTDGSDEPWGVLALVTVLVLLVRERRELVLPTRSALVASCTLAGLAAVAIAWLPAILAAAIAMGALAVFLQAARPLRPRAPLLTLLLLALPIIASLQFYLGYPLRVATAHAAAPLLNFFGLGVTAAGAAFEWRGTTVLVDPPCAGIGMLWVGAYTAALLSYLGHAGAGRTLVNGAFAAAVVFAANVLRNAVLFVTEAGIVQWPAWTHAAIGLAAFALALVPIIHFVRRPLPFAAPSLRLAGETHPYPRPLPLKGRGDDSRRAETQRREAARRA